MVRKKKDSGIEWIGEIPEDWSVRRLKRVFSNRVGGAWGEEVKNNENDRVCIRIADFDYSKFKIKSDITFTKRNYKKDVITKLELKQGDILIEKSGGGETTPVGRSVLYDLPIRALYANFMDRLRVCEDNSAEFIEYVLVAFYQQGITKQYIKQTTGLQNLDLGQMLSEELIVVPTKEEQIRIADYLDKKCTKIDEIIEKEKQVIDKLKEYKQSVITETVTKGLNPDVEMKDSGVEWIGEIPEHWKIEKIKYVLEKPGIKIGPFGSALKSNEIMEKSDIKVYGQANLIRNDFRYGNKYINFEKFKELSSYEILKGDVLISMMGTIGKCSIFPESAERGIMDSHLTKMTLDTKKVNLQYFKRYFSETFIIDNYLKEISKGSIMNGLNSSILKNILLILPPISEQLVILEYLDKKCSEIDKVISDKEKLIEKLTEYKKSLIYECVTGKREIKDK